MYDTAVIQSSIFWATAIRYSCMARLENLHEVSFPKKQQFNAEVKSQTSNLAVAI